MCRYALFNNTDTNLERCAFEIVLPEGYVFPKVDTIGAPPGTVVITFSMRPGPRRVLASTLFQLLSLGYLVRFRDLTYRRPS